MTVRHIFALFAVSLCVTALLVTIFSIESRSQTVNAFHTVTCLNPKDMTKYVHEFSSQNVLYYFSCKKYTKSASSVQ